MSEELSFLYLPLYVHRRFCHRILYVYVHYKWQFTFYSFLLVLTKIIMKRNNYIQSFLLIHIFTFLAFFFPSNWFTFLFCVILQLEKYPLAFLVLQVFGKPNLSFFSKKFLFYPWFQEYLHYTIPGGHNLYLYTFPLAFKNIIPFFFLGPWLFLIRSRGTFIFFLLCTIPFYYECFQIVFDFSAELVWIWKLINFYHFWVIFLHCFFKTTLSSHTLFLELLLHIC